MYLDICNVDMLHIQADRECLQHIRLGDKSKLDQGTSQTHALVLLLVTKCLPDLLIIDIPGFFQDISDPYIF